MAKQIPTRAKREFICIQCTLYFGFHILQSKPHRTRTLSPQDGVLSLPSYDHNVSSSFVLVLWVLLVNNSCFPSQVVFTMMLCIRQYHHLAKDSAMPRIHFPNKRRNIACRWYVSPRWPPSLFRDRYGVCQYAPSRKSRPFPTRHNLQLYDSHLVRPAGWLTGKLPFKSVAVVCWRIMIRTDNG